MLDDATNEMTVAREEIFGPVVTVLTFRDEAEAVRIANDTPYGLSGLAVDAATRRAPAAGRPRRCARACSASTPTRSVFAQTPFGGYKQSGVGKELGMHALEHNTELKSVFISTE